MKFEYEGFILEIEEILNEQGRLDYYRTYCDIRVLSETGIWKNYDLESIITMFKKAVDKYLANENKKSKPDFKMNFQLDMSKVNEFYKEVDKLLNMKITSTYKGYPVEIKLDGDKLYSCTIKTRYGVEDKEISKKSLDYILYQQQGIVDDYKSFGELAPNERVYHILEIEYKDFTLKSYYNYNTNQSFLFSISPKRSSYEANIKEKKEFKKEELGFTPSTNTQELIDQFITFVDSREIEVKKTKELENIDTGISFEYRRTTTKVKLLDFESGKCFNCVDGTIVDSSILGLYEKFKNAIDGK